jgi:glycerol-3-phosphate dehydrogenase
VKRDLERLEAQEFDLLVVGGGIYGATAVREAALRGLRVALIERDDFGHATSSNSLKIIHGGLRYLQHADLRRMRRSIRARRRLMRIAPHLVHPLKFVVPTYGHSAAGREIMGLALAINDILSWDRNKAVETSKHIPRGRIISASKCLDYMPHINRRGLTGGAVWYDCIAENTERLVLEFILAAAGEGACIANYVEADSFVLKGGVFKGVIARDKIANRSLEIRSKILINATGPWSNELLSKISKDEQIKTGWAKAVNIVLNKAMFDDYAVGLPGRTYYWDKDAVLSRGKRFFFCVPWRKGTIIGTTYQSYHGDPRECDLSGDDITDLLGEISRYCPDAEISPRNVCFSHIGLVPVAIRADGSSDSIQLKKKSTIYDHERRGGLKGIITIEGVKYTTAVETAREAVNVVLMKLGRQPQFPSDEPGLPGAVKGGEKRVDDLISREAMKNLQDTYGSGCHDILKLVASDPTLGRPLTGVDTTIKAEIVHGVRNEMAQTLSDVVMRRTTLGSFGDPGTDALMECAGIMAKELGWGPSQRQGEIDAVKQRFKTSSKPSVSENRIKLSI